ncbi:glycine hydroxymethyltransferase [Fibrobacter intestinalis]|uniref:Serine hydroxymethyltransferase n=2 Tax=Fibrobacter TaxID=832 RepID=A0A1M6UPK9_9BACT|nr:MULTISPECIES: serine hydroxymethyltransferase [Fibrobacter]MDD7299562.1 serine hydroxymethyltransferase [Fibrobacter intestinalis]PBC67801.1 glycine hydroxymethyltransferase [Fibrobacter sp. UWS1]SHK71106.1 glycine hydroxymethyltransferase [Fibrobacter intestinalis]
MMTLKQEDPAIYDLIQEEADRQEYGIELIASENYTSKAVMEAMGSVLTNKYSEGYIGKRYYGGNQVIDKIEAIAIERCKQLFGCDHVNVQPLSGSPANAAVYFAVLKPGDKVLGLKLDHGGHLSHGHPVNFSGMLYNFVQYEVDKETGRIDMDKVREIALREKPKMILAGFSAYSRNLDWKRFKEIADEVGALTMADISHIAGLIAGKAIESPVPYFDIVTTTTHKTLRGPRSAIIMCKDKMIQKMVKGELKEVSLAKEIDKGVFPGMQGGPHDHITAGKAVAFGEALKPEFQTYAKNIIKNMQAMADELMKRGYKIISDGTDNHLVVIDMTSKNVSGKEAEVALEKVGISTSRSTIPFDPRKPMDPSGLRVGTAAITTRGFDENDSRKVADIMDRTIQNKDNDEALKAIRQEIVDLCKAHPLYK